MRNQRFKCSDAEYSLYISQRYDKEIASGRLTEEDAALIKEFLNDQAGKISPAREYTLLCLLIAGRRYFSKYHGISTGNAQEGVKKILSETTTEGTSRYSQNTKADLIKVAKRFFLWMCDNEYGENLNEKKIRNISPPPLDRMTKTADDILTKEEVESVIKAAKNSRDRAMIAVLYEAGLRSRELAELTWKDVKFNAQTVVINTAGKTGKPRYIPCVLCREYLIAWKNDYPGEIAPDNYVFVTLSRPNMNHALHEPLSYICLNAQVKRMLQRAGVTRHITPHCFRHSRVTHLIQDEMPETYIKKMMWGSVSTDMFQTYAHIVNDDLDKSIAKLNGITIEDEAEKKRNDRFLHPVQCPHCGTVNTSTAKYCCECSTPLKDEAKTDSDRRREAVEILLADDKNIVEVLSYYQNKIKNKNSCSISSSNINP